MEPLLHSRTSGDERQCRICLETNDPESMIAPCSCAGSQKWVHRSCLDEWRAQERVPHAFTRCPTCRFEYQTEIRKGLVSSYWFQLNVLRDTILLFAAAQGVLALVGYVIHSLDSGGAIKSLYPHSWAERKAAIHLSLGPYYVTSVVVCLAVLGVVGIWLQRTGRLPPAPLRLGAVRRHRPEPSCHCDSTDCTLGCDACCRGCCDLCGSCHGCELSCCECGGGGCDLSGCGGVAVEGEGAALLLPIVAAVAIVLALVGLFYAVFFATIVVQRVVQRHVHLLQMRTEAQRVVVIDMASRPCGGPAPMAFEGLATRV